MKIKIRNGLQIPLRGSPSGPLNRCPPLCHVALNLDPFDDLRFRLIVKVGDQVQIGSPIVENRAIPGHFFVSPAAGEITEIRRGLKRRIVNVIIKVSDKESSVFLPPLLEPTREQVIHRLLEGGALAHIKTRPFNKIPNPRLIPRDIFVSAIETSPYAVPTNMQLEGHEEAFLKGLNALKLLTTGKVHLVTKEDFCLETPGVERHLISGPHPAGNPSVHIHHIAPIRDTKDLVWTLSAYGVILIGYLIYQGSFFTDKILSIAGEGILPDKQSFIFSRQGASIGEVLKDRAIEGPFIHISGDPLMGSKVDEKGFLGFFDHVVCALPVAQQSESFHFFRLGTNKFSATRTYISGFLKGRTYSFTTAQHGEPRAFIDSHVYSRVMPMRIPTVQLIKAILAEDYDLAQQLGLLEVAPEDFALPTFICPSKIEMVDIVKKGLRAFSQEIGFH